LYQLNELILWTFLPIFQFRTLCFLALSNYPTKYYLSQFEDQDLVTTSSQLNIVFLDAYQQEISAQSSLIYSGF
jgi:hypothetical protein